MRLLKICRDYWGTNFKGSRPERKRLEVNGCEVILAKVRRHFQPENDFNGPNFSHQKAYL